MSKGDRGVANFHAGRANGEWITTVCDITDILTDEAVLQELGLEKNISANYDQVGFEAQDEHVLLRNKTERLMTYVIGTITPFAWRQSPFGKIGPYVFAQLIHENENLVQAGLVRIRLLWESVLAAKRMVINREGSFWHLVATQLEEMSWTREPMVRE
eukprot:5711412-Karenia_brevis.AAC.1